MSSALSSAAEPGAPPRPQSAVPGRRAVLLMVLAAVLVAAGLRPFTRNTYIEVLGESIFVGICLLFAFTAAGAWKQDALPRSAAQLLALLVAATLGPLVIQLLTAGGDFSRFVSSRPHVRGYVMVTAAAGVIGVVLGIGSLFRERVAQARAQALQLELLRERLERQATDARLGLMTAQIQPHFLLNTLANVQELVESGSPRAVPVFRSLIAYLRAAVPKLQQDEATLEQEEKLVTAYLELMQMRMPDRMQFSVSVDVALRAMPFPPMALLTLVENAVHHGIDPSCEGGRIDVQAVAGAGGEVRITVSDDGDGMAATAAEGTGLTNLKARLAAFYPKRAQLVLSEQAPHGLRAEIRIAPGA